MPDHPQRLRRADSFFGVHFDFHCREDDREVGARTTPGMIRRLLEQVRPDYVQVDCKGHPGVASYPSEVGTPAGGFAKDQLAMWRKETEKAGVALYVHYSGVWDSAAMTRHPEWAVRDEKGKPHPRASSVFGPYVDELMIPQLVEIAERYRVDGVWVDGDCWSTTLDGSVHARRAWRRATGLARIPRSPEDPAWEPFREFCRQGFRDYLAHYVDELHRRCPGLQMASNWAYSSHMPEFVNTGVDFLSGDFWPQDAVNSARFEGRILASQGRPWDLMSWGFGTASGDGFRNPTPKPARQLMHEAALVLAQGGGYQCYFKQKRDASISGHDVATYAAVAPFVRERQALCQGASAVPQVGLLYSTGPFYREAPNLFSPWGGVSDAYRGVVQALVEGGLPVAALHDGHVREGKLEGHRLIVVPEWVGLDSAVRRGLLAWTRAGGRLLVIGPEAAREFRRELGVKVGAPEEARTWCWDSGLPPPADGGPPPMAGLTVSVAEAKPRPGTRTHGWLWSENDRTGRRLPAATSRRLGQGRIAALWMPLGRTYLNARCANVRQALAHLVRALAPDLLAELLTPATVDLTIQTKDGRIAVHLVNTAVPHASDRTWTAPHPTPELTLLLRTPERPRRLRMEPEGASLSCRRHPEGWVCTIPPVEIHRAVSWA